MRERITMGPSGRIIGLPARTVQEMACAGKIPGAVKFGRSWTFDEAQLRNWIKRKEQEQWAESVKRQRECSGVAKPSIRNFKSKVSDPQVAQNRRSGNC